MDRSTKSARSRIRGLASLMYKRKRNRTPSGRSCPASVHSVVFVGLAFIAGPVTAVTSCEEWGGSASFGLDSLVIDMRLAEMRNEGDYFRTATAEEIIACMESGANPMARVGHSGETPLHLAAIYNDDPAVIDAMVHTGADPMVRDRWSETPLHWAVRNWRASADQTERDWLLATILEAEQFDCYYVWRSNHDGTWGTCYHFKTDNHLSYRFRGEAVEIELTGSESCANERNYARLRGQLDTLVESLDAAGLRVSGPNHPDFSSGYRF